MVYFSCGNCGDTLKKAQVTSHSCRQAKFACLDCKKEFTSRDSVKHIECISEAEKYSGGTYKPKPGAQSAKNKADEWKLFLLDTLGKTQIATSMKNEIQGAIQKSVLPRNINKFKNYLNNVNMFPKTKELFIRLFEDTAKALEEAKKGASLSKAVEDEDHSEKKTDKPAVVQKPENVESKKRKLEEELGTSEEPAAPKTKRVKHKRNKRERETGVAELDKSNGTSEEPAVFETKKTKHKRSKRTRETGVAELDERNVTSEEPAVLETKKTKHKRNKKESETNVAEPDERNVTSEVLETKKSKQKRNKRARENGAVEVVPHVVTEKEEKKRKHSCGKEIENLTEVLGEVHLNTIGGSAEPTLIGAAKKAKKSKGTVIAGEGESHNSAKSSKRDKMRKTLSKSKECELVNSMVDDTATATMDAEQNESNNAEKGQSCEGMETSSTEKLKMRHVVKSILERAEDNELSMKKLIKKVLKRYFLAGAVDKEELEMKMLMTLSRSSSFKSTKNSVTLVQKTK